MDIDGSKEKATMINWRPISEALYNQRLLLWCPEGSWLDGGPKFGTMNSHGNWVMEPNNTGGMAGSQLIRSEPTHYALLNPPVDA